MPGDDDKTKDTSPEPTLAELAKIMRETCSAVKDLGARVQALEVAAQATTVAMPDGFPYGLPGYGGIPLTSAPSTTTPQATSAPKLITEIPFPHSPSQPPLFTDRRNPTVTGRRTCDDAGAPPTPTAPTSNPLSTARAAAHSRGWAFRASASWSSPPTTVLSIR
jgi:hypothetical protein